MTEGEPDSVTSKDGTRIAFWRYGLGPPLVVVHGTTADHTRWAPAIPALSADFTVCAMDRRGRGGSGDAEPYALEREFEDVAAVVDSFDEPGSLLGHSYGAICSLEALHRTGNVRKLVLYEPPIPAGTPIYPPGAIERLQARLDAGDREGVVVAFFQEVVRMPAHELEMFRKLPVWAARVAAAHTIPREMRASMEYRIDPQAFRASATPALLLLGGASPPFLKAGTEAVKKALRNGRLVVLPGQQHAAIDTATELFTSEVLRFLRAG